MNNYRIWSCVEALSSEKNRVLRLSDRITVCNDAESHRLSVISKSDEPNEPILMISGCDNFHRSFYPRSEAEAIRYLTVLLLEWPPLFFSSEDAEKLSFKLGANLDPRGVMSQVDRRNFAVRETPVRLHDRRTLLLGPDPAKITAMIMAGPSFANILSTHLSSRWLTVSKETPVSCEVQGNGCVHRASFELDHNGSPDPDLAVSVITSSPTGERFGASQYRCRFRDYSLVAEMARAVAMDIEKRECDFNLLCLDGDSVRISKMKSSRCPQGSRRSSSTTVLFDDETEFMVYKVKEEENLLGVRN